MSLFRILYGIFHFCLSIFALYLSFKCNNGFKLSSFLVSLIFPYIYVIYIFATTKNFCMTF